VPLRVAVFVSGWLNSPGVNPAYSPPSAHHPVRNSKFESVEPLERSALGEGCAMWLGFMPPVEELAGKYARHPFDPFLLGPSPAQSQVLI